MMTEGVYASASEALRDVLDKVRSAEHLKADGPDAPRLRRGSRERLNFCFELTDPTRRLSENIALYPAVARFVWMMTANNRLADIAFHEPKVGSFTDDSFTVPGSSYGMRLRQPQPGVDQIKGIINRLKLEKDSRRAAVSIYHPVDAIRESNDIPCAFGLFFHNRQGTLRTTILMRSNNALRLLPFNMFEFSLLAEVVAAETGNNPGPINYFAGSMHLYDEDLDEAEKFLNRKKINVPTMERMPTNVSPLEELTKLGKLEADLRHGSGALTKSSVVSWIERIKSELSPYWGQLALVLLCGTAAKVDVAAFKAAKNEITSDLLAFLPLASKSAAQNVLAAGLGPLFEGVNSPQKVVPLWRSEASKQFQILASEHEKQSGALIGITKLLAAQSHIFDRLAARGEEVSLTDEVFQEALKAVEELS